MAFAIAAKRQTQPDTHRTYSDTEGRNMVHCRRIVDASLLKLASSADQIEIPQPLGGRWVPSNLIDRIAGGLRALPLLTSHQVVNAGTMLQRLRLVLSDHLARVRPRHGRHVLAGEIKRLVAVDRKRVSSCYSPSAPLPHVIGRLPDRCNSAPGHCPHRMAECRLPTSTCPI